MLKIKKKTFHLFQQLTPSEPGSHTMFWKDSASTEGLCGEHATGQSSTRKHPKVCATVDPPALLSLKGWWFTHVSLIIDADRKFPFSWIPTDSHFPPAYTGNADRISK